MMGLRIATRPYLFFVLCLYGGMTISAPTKAQISQDEHITILTAHPTVSVNVSIEGVFIPPARLELPPVVIKDKMDLAIASDNTWLCQSPGSLSDLRSLPIRRQVCDLITSPARLDPRSGRNKDPKDI